MSLIDILQKSYTVGQGDFTVNVAVPDVAVAPLLVLDVFANAFGASFFENGDNFKIRNIWFNTPHGFRQGSGNFNIGLELQPGGGANPTYALLPFLNSGVTALWVPDFTQALEFGDAAEVQQTTSAFPGLGRARIVSKGMAGLKISMANVPAILNTLVFPVNFFIEVEHTLPLVFAA